MRHKATEAGVLKNARGREVKMAAGPCIFCGEWVEEGREEAGATNPFDPCWHVGGDFGCWANPVTGEDGTGDHMRPYDLALRLLREVGEAH